MEGATSLRGADLREWNERKDRALAGPGTLVAKRFAHKENQIIKISLLKKRF